MPCVMSNLIAGADDSELVIDINHLGKHYETGTESISVLRDVNLHVYRGEMVAVMGPSGSGKSTLLFILGLFQPPSMGEYRVSGIDVLALTRDQQAIFRREMLGFVFQTCDLLENSTVYENLELPLIYAGVPRRERPDRIREALRMVNLDHRIHQRSNRLSGGERQRVSIARALVNEPEFILADEPTGQLDRENSLRVLEYFTKITEEARTAMVVVTHDNMTAEHCTRTSVLMDGSLNG